MPLHQFEKDVEPFFRRQASEKLVVAFFGILKTTEYVNDSCHALNFTTLAATLSRASRSARRISSWSPMIPMNRRIFARPPARYAMQIMFQAVPATPGPLAIQPVRQSPKSAAGTTDVHGHELSNGIAFGHEEACSSSNFAR